MDRWQSASTSTSRSIRAHGFTCRGGRWPQAGAVHATVYRDLNDNGVRDPDEPLEKGALITTGSKPGRTPTDAKGSVTVGGLGISRRSPSGSTNQPGGPDAGAQEGAAGRGPAPGVAAEVANRPGRRRRRRGRDRQERRPRLRRRWMSSWSIRPARSSPPRAPTSTASSCSSASPTATTPCE